MLCLAAPLAALLACGPPPEAAPTPTVLVLEVRSDEPEGGTGSEDAAARRFLESGYYKPAVQFGCGRTSHPFEDRLETALREGDGKSRLRALVLLMKARAPASVDLQWKALKELRDLPGAGKVLAELRAQFSEPAILNALDMAPPDYRYKQDALLEWHVRAAGVIRSREALPTLVRLSRSENLGASLAAELSLEDFDGLDGDHALVQCLLGWQYDAYVRAGRALLGRNKPLLVRTLQTALVPEGCRYWQAVLLARADDPSAVPVLCDTIPTVGIIDREMFEHLERLAKPGDLPLVRLLAVRARPEQQERARRLEETLLGR